MLSFISFILVCVGAINWFSIGILQYDFVAGLFGSQANIFSRIIYTLVCIAAIIVIANLIANKGKFVVSFKKASKEYDKYMEEKHEKNVRLARATEADEEHDFKPNSSDSQNNNSCHNCNCNNKESYSDRDHESHK